MLRPAPRFALSSGHGPASKRGVTKRGAICAILSQLAGNSLPSWQGLGAAVPLMTLGVGPLLSTATNLTPPNALDNPGVDVVGPTSSASTEEINRG